MRPTLALTFALFSLFSGCTDDSGAPEDLDVASDEGVPASGPSASDDTASSQDPAAGQTASKDFVLIGGVPDSIKFHFAGGSLRPSAEGAAMATVNFGVWGVGSCVRPNGNLLTSVVIAGTNQFGCGSVPAGDYELSFGIDAGEAVGKLVIPNATLL